MLVKNRSLTFVILFLVTILLFVANIALGSVSIPLNEVLVWFFGGDLHETKWDNILLFTRLPQAITACIAGASLALGGLQMQTLFRNPLAGPSILGISSGASLGVAVIILLFSSIAGTFSFAGFGMSLLVTIAAFAGAMLVLLVIMLLAGYLKNNAMLLIVGIMIGYASSAIVGVMQYFSSDTSVHNFVMWGLGSFSKVSLQQHAFFTPVSLVVIFASLFLIKPLNMLLLGENYAANLGLNVKRARMCILILTGLLTALVTAFCGPISFLGLAVPHLAKNLFKTSNHGVLLPGVILMGAILALFCNVIAGLPMLNSTLPINAVTSLIGAPIVVSIILKRRVLLD